jgi:hypothetical protein
MEDKAAHIPHKDCIVNLTPLCFKKNKKSAKERHEIRKKNRLE